MNTDAFIKLYKDRGYDDKAIDSAVKALVDAEKFFKSKDSTLEDATTEQAKEYINYLIENGENSLDTLLAAARYFFLIKNNDVYIHFTKVLGGLGVIESIKKRMETFAGAKTAQKVMDGFTMPPLGTPLEDMPRYTNDLIGRIKAGLEPKLYIV